MRPYQLVAGASLGFLLGCLLASRLPTGQAGLPILLVGGFCLGLILYLLVAKLKLRQAGLVFLIFLIIGALRYQQTILAFANHHPTLAVGKSGMATMQVVNQPLQSTGGTIKLMVQLVTLNQIPATGNLLLTINDASTLAVGDLLTAKIRREPFPAHPGFLLKDGVIFPASVLSVSSIEVSHRPSLPKALFAARNWMANRISDFLPAAESQLINGLLLGIRSDLPQSLKDNLQRSGTTHIVALSGFNITMVIVFLTSLLSWLPRRPASIWAGIGILLFIIMTGLSSSVVRAAVMGWLLLLGSWWGRKTHMGTALAVAAASMVAIHPLILQYDIGFQLSLLAMAGLIFISPIISAILPKILHRWKIVSAVIIATTSATLATLPLVVFYFGGVSLVGLISNLLIVPLVPVVMLVGLVGLGFGLIGGWMSLLSWTIWLPARLLLELINFFGGLSWAYLRLPSPNPMWVAGSYLIMLIIVVLIHFRLPLSNRKNESF